MTYARLGRKDDAIREAILATDLIPTSHDAVEGPTYEETLAAVYATVGEEDAALDLIERIFSRPGQLSPGLLRLDPVWDPLRKNPRFQTLLKKYPLPD
jgi:serine/threonine-protein kinase